MHLAIALGELRRMLVEHHVFLPAVRRKNAQIRPFLADPDGTRAEDMRQRKEKAAAIWMQCRALAGEIWAKNTTLSVNAVAGKVSGRLRREMIDRHKDTIRKEIADLKPRER